MRSKKSAAAAAAVVPRWHRLIQVGERVSRREKLSPSRPRQQPPAAQQALCRGRRRPFSTHDRRTVVSPAVCTTRYYIYLVQMTCSVAHLHCTIINGKNWAVYKEV